MSTKFIRQMMADFAPYHETKRMTYEDGIYLLALGKYYQVTKDEDFLTDIDAYLKRHIDEAGMIENYHLEEYNIDNILAGNALFFAYEKTHEKRYLKAIELLRTQLKTHPRTKSGSFWHKLRYPYQIWLDGLYMGQVFYLHYGLNQEDEAIIADCMKQIENVRDLLWDEDKKLYLHAYDEKKVMQWADKTTGRSPNVWSRSVGWLAMAFVELYDLLEGKGVFAKRLAQLLLELLEGMLVQLDPTSKMWHQLVDKPSVEGNYLETSGSAMLAYAMLKGSRLGMLEKTYQTEGLSVLEGIEKKYLKEANGKLYLEGTCQVAGLDNERRNGSDRYYLSEKVVTNEIKGLAPYFFALTERMQIK